VTTVAGWGCQRMRVFQQLFHLSQGGDPRAVEGDLQLRCRCQRMTPLGRGSAFNGEMVEGGWLLRSRCQLTFRTLRPLLRSTRTTAVFQVSLRFRCMSSPVLGESVVLVIVIPLVPQLLLRRDLHDQGDDQLFTMSLVGGAVGPRGVTSSSRY